MKTVIVTGGNRGIGLEICRQLDERGFRVILGSRTPSKGVSASKGLSRNIIVRQLDVTDIDSVNRLYDFVKSEFGSLDILINNAGIGEYYRPQNKAASGIKNIVRNNFNGVFQTVKTIRPLLEKTGLISREKSGADVSLDDVKVIMETNFYGAWRMIQVFIPLLVKSGSGKIINISSGMGELKSLSGFYPGYSLSKASLNALTILFSNELKEKGIKVNAICPGWVKSDMGGQNAPRSLSEGAETAVWLAAEENISSGCFFRDRQKISW